MSGLQLLPTDPEDLMRVVTAAFAQGDLRPLTMAVHKDIVWKTASPRVGLFRFGGTHQRRTGVMEVTGEIASEYIFRRLEAKEIVARGDVVWGLFDAEIKYQPVGDKRVYPIIQLDIAMRWRIKDGKIVEHQAFFDTAALLVQRGDLKD
ncbi:MAG TPA: nuclear transport factor 2 family protein [Rhizomicrobium sp.]|jgi:ketosteroid isomerase-like protein|nr:nuclear transport factor 2 family protein [Rhizomicrobium sp.]